LIHCLRRDWFMAEEIYSPGLEGVIAGETAVSSLAGGLAYRGYSIEDLAANSTFEETAYLILHGELPKAAELADFQKRLAANAADFPHEILNILRHIPTGAGMMDVMRTGASLLAHWAPETGDNSHDANVRKAERLLARLPVVLAARQRLLQGKEPVHADPSRSLAGNLLWMLTRQPPNDRWTRIL